MLVVENRGRGPVGGRRVGEGRVGRNRGCKTGRDPPQLAIRGVEEVDLRERNAGQGEGVASYELVARLANFGLHRV